MNKTCQNYFMYSPSIYSVPGDMNTQQPTKIPCGYCNLVAAAIFTSNFGVCVFDRGFYYWICSEDCFQKTFPIRKYSILKIKKSKIEK